MANDNVAAAAKTIVFLIIGMSYYFHLKLMPKRLLLDSSIFCYVARRIVSFVPPSVGYLVSISKNGCIFATLSHVRRSGRPTEVRDQSGRRGATPYVTADD